MWTRQAEDKALHTFIEGVVVASYSTSASALSVPSSILGNL